MENWRLSINFAKTYKHKKLKIMEKITAFVKFVVVMISSIVMSVGLQSCAEESTNLEDGLISSESFVVEYNHVKYSLDPVKKEATAIGYILSTVNLYNESVDIENEIEFGGAVYPVVAIGEEAFKGSICRTVSIESNVKIIHDRAFEGCNMIFMISLRGRQLPLLGNDVFEASVRDQAFLYVPKGVDVSGTKWSEFANIEEE